jgi:hypothetical protein
MRVIDPDTSEIVEATYNDSMGVYVLESGVMLSNVEIVDGSTKSSGRRDHSAAYGMLIIAGAFFCGVIAEHVRLSVFAKPVDPVFRVSK